MYKILTVVFSLFITFINVWATDIPSEKVLRIYHDADWSNHIESADSIWKGVNTALSEVNYKVQGYKIELVKKNHRGNVIRSLHNMKKFLEDDKALAIISGINSPPLIKHRSFINEKRILMLVPWAAGGPITRYPSAENWVFRVSVDDTKAGKVLVDYAIKNKHCKSPHLLLENTSWGKSNLKNMTAALATNGKSSVHVTYFDWNIKGYTSRSKLENIIKKYKDDCVLLVANTIEGIEIAKSMSAMPKEKRLPIISHWGITGGNFHKVIDANIRNKIDISFIQSCFSFVSPKLSKKGQQVFKVATTIYPHEIKEVSDIKSPAGFIHAYDMTLLFLKALNKIKITNNINSNRNSLRLALENITKPVEGLIKNYQKPFSIFSLSNIDAHEALGVNDYCMASYNKDNQIILLESK